MYPSEVAGCAVRATEPQSFSVWMAYLADCFAAKAAPTLDEAKRTKFNWIEFTRHIPVTRPPGHHRKRDVQN